jgi:hypothetical protein
MRAIRIPKFHPEAYIQLKLQRTYECNYFRTSNLVLFTDESRVMQVFDAVKLDGNIDRSWRSCS